MPDKLGRVAPLHQKIGMKAIGYVRWLQDITVGGGRKDIDAQEEGIKKVQDWKGGEASRHNFAEPATQIGLLYFVLCQRQRPSIGCFSLGTVAGSAQQVGACGVVEMVGVQRSHQFRTLQDRQTALRSIGHGHM